MREKIERLSKGIFEYEQPDIMLSENVLRITVNEGEVKTGSFVISNTLGTPIKGVIYCNIGILRFESTSFSDAQNEICYSVDGSGFLAEGHISGRIDIISDCGEACIPFTVIRADSTCPSSLGMIDNYFSFQSLAQSNWKEAVEVFDSKGFYYSIIKKDSNLKRFYDALKASPDRNLALKEFLLSQKKINDWAFSTDTTEIDIDNEAGIYMCRILVYRNTWVYDRIEIENAGKFVSLSKSVIENDDFENGVFELKVILNLNDLKDGVYFSSVTLFDNRYEIVIPITCHVKNGKEADRAVKLQMNELRVGIYDLYLDYRCSLLTAREFTEDSLNEIGKLKKILERNDFSEEQKAENERVLKHYEIYERYIRGLSEKKYNDKELVSGAIRTFLGITFMPGDSRKSYYKDIFYAIEDGKRSPILFVEAALILSEEPELLTTLDQTSIIILTFMLRNGLANEDVTARFISLCRDQANNVSMSLVLLKEVYELRLDNILLSALCSQVIRRDIRDEKWHPYFREAVNRQLTVPKLYEYYIYTYRAGSDEVISPSVLNYFAENRGLDSETLINLFAYVLRNKDTNKAVYKAYRDSIAELAYESLENKRISDDLVLIYSDVFDEIPIDETMMENVPDVLFSHHVKTDNKRFVDLIVCDDHEIRETVYPLVDGKADVIIFSERNTLWFRDAAGNRFYAFDTAKRYLYLPQVLLKCYEKGSTNRHLIFNIWEQNGEYDLRPDLYADIQARALALSQLTPEFENECRFNLSEYYYDNYDSERLDYYLTLVDITALDEKKRVRYLELMIVRNMYDKIIPYVKEFGLDNMAVRRFSKLCVHAIENMQDDSDKPSIIFMSHFAFLNGGKDETILRFLADNFLGTGNEMYEIWSEAKERGLDTLKIEENIIAQVLFTGSYLEAVVPVFRSYRAKSANRKMIRAFMSYTAYLYFVRDGVVEDEFFEILKDDPGLENSKISILALLKHYSEKDNLTKEELEFCDVHVRQFAQMNMFFAFFKNFTGRLSVPHGAANKSYVEYRGNPEKTVYIHYSINNDRTFTTEQMIDVGYGFFTKELVLFHGDILQYYITENNGDTEEITESRLYKFINYDENESEKTKYDEINNILVAVEMQDSETALQYIEQYYRTEFAINSLFRPV